MALKWIEIRLIEYSSYYMSILSDIYNKSGYSSISIDKIKLLGHNSVNLNLAFILLNIILNYLEPFVKNVYTSINRFFTNWKSLTI